MTRDYLMALLLLIPTYHLITPLLPVTVEQQIAAPSASFNIDSHLEKDQKESLLKLLREYEDIFSKSSSDIGRTDS
jgi:hypothetical protein